MEGTRLGPYRIERKLGSGGMGRLSVIAGVPPHRDIAAASGERGG